MIACYEDLSVEALTPLGFDDAGWACRMLQDLAGHDIPDDAYGRFLDVATDALAPCPDPDRALANLAHLADAVVNRRTFYDLLAAQPATTSMLVNVIAASQFLANLLIANPEQMEVLTDPDDIGAQRDAESLWRDMERRVGIGKTPNARRDALRRFKRTEILRIGSRDLLGFADMAATVREISDFADCCVRMALQICTEELELTDPPFAVIGMGKLAARELNYSSDIDLIFVHDDGITGGTPAPQALQGFDPIRLAEKVTDSLARITDAGFVFRVDLRLRPEGRFGPVSRSVEATQAYYESWAEPWERQALLKARPVAGHPDVMAAFERIRDDFVFGTRVDDTFVESLRANKRRIEEKAQRAGEAEINVKEGVGGVRDVEWAVQLLQLIAGHMNAGLRDPNTLTAIDRLAEAGLLSADERQVLSEGYVFTRTVEHHLQLMDELPIRTLPRDPLRLDRLARGLGYANAAGFNASYAWQTSRINTVFRRIFYGETAIEINTDGPEIAKLLAETDDEADNQIVQRLLAAGFKDPAAARSLLRFGVVGSEYGGMSPQAQEAFTLLLPALIDAASASGDPDAALRSVETLALAVPSRAALYRSLADSDDLLRRLCRLAAMAPSLWQRIVQRPEYLDVIADDDTIEATTERPIDRSNIDALGHSLDRSRFLVGALDAWARIDVAEVQRQLTRLAVGAVDAAIAIAADELAIDAPLAVIGLGKLGGGELGYSSDLDVVYVSTPGRLDEAAQIVKRMQVILYDGIASGGVRYEVDPRLRPDGKKGPLVLDVDAYQAYYADKALTWERQALTKASLVCGDQAQGHRFLEVAREFVYGRPFTEEDADAIRTMKRRIETERVTDPADVKLGPGGLADIEWTVQMLQLRNQRWKRIRKPNTLAALRALRDDAVIRQDDWEVLDAAYRALTAARNRAYLRTGLSDDVIADLPMEIVDLRRAVRSVFERIFVEDENTTTGGTA